MNLEEYKKYVIEINNNIENLLKDNKEELKFYQLLVNVLNQICEEQNNLEQALNEIEKYIEEHKHLNWYVESCYKNDLLKIIQKAKGDVKNENNRFT